MFNKYSKMYLIFIFTIFFPSKEEKKDKIWSVMFLIPFVFKEDSPSKSNCW